MVPGDTKQFNATVLNSDNRGVKWSVNDVNGGDAAVGRISNSGVYTAPETVPTPDIVTIRATSRQDPSRLTSRQSLTHAPLLARVAMGLPPRK